jgi:hypothetical protein
MERHQEHGNSCIGKHFIGMILKFGRFSHGEKHGSVQAGMVLEKKLRVLYLDLQGAEGDCEPY